MSFNGIGNLRPEGYKPLPGPARVKPAPQDPSGIRGREITGVIIDDLECRGCGASLAHGELECTYCNRPNPFAIARQAAKAIEVTQLDDYAPRFVFDGTMTANEAREFAMMWAREQSRPGATIPLPAGVEFARDGAYALPSLHLDTPRRNGKAHDAGSTLISRLIARLFR